MILGELRFARCQNLRHWHVHQIAGQQPLQIRASHCKRAMGFRLFRNQPGFEIGRRGHRVPGGLGKFFLQGRVLHAGKGFRRILAQKRNAACKIVERHVDEDRRHVGQIALGIGQHRGHRLFARDQILHPLRQRREIALDQAKRGIGQKIDIGTGVVPPQLYRFVFQQLAVDFRRQHVTVVAVHLRKLAAVHGAQLCLGGFQPCDLGLLRGGGDVVQLGIVGVHAGCRRGCRMRLPLGIVIILNEAAIGCRCRIGRGIACRRPGQKSRRTERKGTDGFQTHACPRIARIRANLAP